MTPTSLDCRPTESDWLKVFEHCGTIPRLYSDAGYHFCPEWDDMLIGPDTPEWDACLCEVKKRIELEIKL